MSEYTQIAATFGAVRSEGSGLTPLAHSDLTLPGVSAPSRVVRSIMEMARSMAYAFAVVLIERVPSMAARPSRPTASTPGNPCRKRRSAASEAVTSAREASRAAASGPWAGTVDMVTRRAYLRA